MSRHYSSEGSHSFFPWIFSLGRHHGARGFGRFAAGLASGFGKDWPPFGAGRKFAAADLHLIILALLAEQPFHGYQIMKALEERSKGFYSPSPGMIYPALAYLEEIGYATVETDGAKKLYRITDAGRRHLEENRTAVDAMLRDLERVGEKLHDIRQFFAGAGFNREGREEHDDDDEDRPGSREVRSAYRALKAALRQKRRCPPEESTRIAQVLLRAAAEILGGRP